MVNELFFLLQIHREADDSSSGSLLWIRLQQNNEVLNCPRALSWGFYRGVKNTEVVLEMIKKINKKIKIVIEETYLSYFCICELQRLVAMETRQ